MLRTHGWSSTAPDASPADWPHMHACIPSFMPQRACSKGNCYMLSAADGTAAALLPTFTVHYLLFTGCLLLNSIKNIRKRQYSKQVVGITKLEANTSVCNGILHIRNTAACQLCLVRSAHTPGRPGQACSNGRCRQWLARQCPCSNRRSQRRAALQCRVRRLPTRVVKRSGSMGAGATTGQQMSPALLALPIAAAFTHLVDVCTVHADVDRHWWNAWQPPFVDKPHECLTWW